MSTLNLKAIAGRFLAPKSTTDDLSRQEFILNVLLATSILIISFATLIRIFNYISPLVSAEEYKNNAMSFMLLLLILIFFATLYILSRKGYFRLASYLLLFIFFLLAFYMDYHWGVELVTGILLYVLVIIMAGILISTRFAFIATIVISLTIAILGFMQGSGLIVTNKYWRTLTWGSSDVIMVSVIFFIIATVSWLSNREIEKSLARARKSEAELKKERDQLEIKVEERTKELKETQAEKMAQVYRFAEFGRLSSGLFHDLINPLNAVSLNMEKVRSASEENEAIAENRIYLEKAIAASNKIGDLVTAVRKQITKQESKDLFSLNEEVRQVIEVLSYKALKNNVGIVFSLPTHDIEVLGSAIKFNQVVLNLIANAIDAYDPSLSTMPDTIARESDKGGRKVEVSLAEDDDNVMFSVKDQGAGIAEENLDKIFEPFFSTKNGSGMGIGLSMVKRIVEKDFGGHIEVHSGTGRGATFIIRFPKMQDHGRSNQPDQK